MADLFLSLSYTELIMDGRRAGFFSGLETKGRKCLTPGSGPGYVLAPGSGTWTKTRNLKAFLPITSSFARFSNPQKCKKAKIRSALVRLTRLKSQIIVLAILFYDLEA